MLNRRLLVATGLLAGVAIGMGWISDAQAQATCTVRRGVTSGDWTLPRMGPGSTGSVSGKLFEKNAVVFDFSAVLEEIVSPCLSCREGTLQGILDDGLGPAPDYLVRGTWIGSFFSGQGTWKATIFKPSSTGALTPVGRMRGVFDDPPTSPPPGKYAGRWVICD